MTDLSNSLIHLFYANSSAHTHYYPNQNFQVVVVIIIIDLQFSIA